MNQAHPVVHRSGNSNNIRTQNVSSSRARTASGQKKVKCREKFLVNLIRATCLLSLVFSIIYSIYIIATCLLNENGDYLSIYLGDTTDIASLSPHTRALHQYRYEELFDDTNNHMINFDEQPKSIDQWSRFELLNYYKNYCYILQHKNLSLFIDVPESKGSEIHATLIDRSVTIKAAKEIYTDYKFYDLKRIYQYLHHRQPIHRVISKPHLWRSWSSEQTKMNNHLWFLTDFIELFNPAFYQEGDRISDTIISPENVNKFLVRATEPDLVFLPIDFLLSILFSVGYMMTMLLLFVMQDVQVGAVALVIISIIHLIMAIFTLKRPEVSELKDLAAILFESQNSNIEIGKVERIQNIFTYHMVELIICLIVLFGMNFVL